MALQSFVSYVTKVTAAWLNKIDTLFVTVFGEAQTKVTARTALFSDLTPAANKLPYFDSATTTAFTDLSAFGRTLIDDAAAANARATLGLVIGTDVQAYDASLVSLATLATAADKIAYTTAADTWAETAITTFGRSLIDDAAASDARTTLGLGTAAVEDITALPDTTLTSADAGATAGPNLTLDRNSASPAASDVLGAIPFKGRDSGAGTDTYAQIQGEIVDPTATSEDGQLSLQTAVAGTLATRGYVRNGLVMGSATGGDRGAGTINATGIYDDGVLLTNGVAATQAEQETASSTTVMVTPGRQQYHPSATKSWVRFSSNGTIAGSYNTTSITDNGAGDWTWNITTAFSNANAVCAVATCGVGGGSPLAANIGAAPGTQTVSIKTFNTISGAATDPASPDIICASAFGDQ